MCSVVLDMYAWFVGVLHVCYVWPAWCVCVQGWVVCGVSLVCTACMVFKLDMYGMFGMYGMYGIYVYVCVCMCVYGVYVCVCYLVFALTSH